MYLASFIAKDDIDNLGLSIIILDSEDFEFPSVDEVIARKIASRKRKKPATVTEKSSEQRKEDDISGDNTESSRPACKVPCCSPTSIVSSQAGCQVRSHKTKPSVDQLLVESSEPRKEEEISDDGTESSRAANQALSCSPTSGVSSQAGCQLPTHMYTTKPSVNQWLKNSKDSVKPASQPDATHGWWHPMVPPYSLPPISHQHPGPPGYPPTTPYTFMPYMALPPPYPYQPPPRPSMASNTLIDPSFGCSPYNYMPTPTRYHPPQPSKSQPSGSQNSDGESSSDNTISRYNASTISL